MLMYIYCILCDIMAESKIIRVDKEVYDKLKNIKIYPSQSFNSVLHFYLHKWGSKKNGRT